MSSARCVEALSHGIVILVHIASIRMSGIQSQNTRDGNTGKFTRLLYAIAKYLPVRHIRKRLPDGTEAAYLERYSIVRTPRLAIYLHHFVDRDQDEELHNHPWRAFSFVLTGSYIERRLVAGLQLAERKVSWFNSIKPELFHMITEAEPGTWTLMIRFRSSKEWGFIGGIEDGQANYRSAVQRDAEAHPAPAQHVI